MQSQIQKEVSFHDDPIAFLTQRIQRIQNQRIQNQMDLQSKVKLILRFKKKFSKQFQSEKQVQSRPFRQKESLFQWIKNMRLISFQAYLSVALTNNQFCLLEKCPCLISMEECILKEENIKVNEMKSSLKVKKCCSRCIQIKQSYLRKAKRSNQVNISEVILQYLQFIITLPTSAIFDSNYSKSSGQSFQYIVGWPNPIEQETSQSSESSLLLARRPTLVCDCKIGDVCENSKCGCRKFDRKCTGKCSCVLSNCRNMDPIYQNYMRELNSNQRNVNQRKRIQSEQKNYITAKRHISNKSQFQPVHFRMI